MNLKQSVAALAAVFTLTAAYAQSTGPGNTPAAPGSPPAAAPGTPPGAGADQWRGGQRHHHHRHGHHGRGAMFGHLDTDRDGTVSMAELQASQQRQTELFQRADTDKDGKLTREEMRAAFASMKGPHRGGPGGPGGPAGYGPRPGAAPAAPAAPAGTGTTSG